MDDAADIEVAGSRRRLVRSLVMLMAAGAITPGSAVAQPISPYTADAAISSSSPGPKPDTRAPGSEGAVIDRIVDGHLAVILVEDRGVEVTVPLAWLPPSAREGSWLQSREGRWLQIGTSVGTRPSIRIDHPRTRAAQASAAERLEALRDARQGRGFQPG